MFRLKKEILIAIAILCAVPACASDYMASEGGKRMSDIAALEDKILTVAHDLNNRVEEFTPEDKTVAITTFVDLNNLDSSSAFGRFIAKRLSMELHKLGFNVRELRQRKSIEFKIHKGEFSLTRKSADLMKNFQVDAILTGTYLMVGDDVVVNAKLIDVDSSRVISVGHMVANLNRLKQIRAMLPKNNRAIPVVKVAHIEGD